MAEILRDRVTFELESIDRAYLNLYVPQLQYEEGIVGFFRRHRGMPIVSSALMGPISTAFVAAIGRFTQAAGVPLVRFKPHERKDDVAAEHLRRFEGEEGVLFVGVAQEKTKVFRSERRHNPQTGAPYPWLARSTAMVNHYYLYAVDRDFGPFFLKFASYFPYTAKLCFNGHEYLKHQLRKAGIAFEAADNAILSCADPARAQALADGLSAERIDHFARTWLARLPQPFSDADRAAGYRYDLSILQAEFSLTQVLDRPLSGRAFFEEVIRENLDLGRPSQVQLIFGRKVIRTTPGRFRTRVITNGVIPSLHLDYKSSRIKQYHKEGRALRTETTINDATDFAIGKRLQNLAALRQVGFKANRRLLDVQRVSHDCAIGEDRFGALGEPCVVGTQRAPALRFGTPRVQALLLAVVACAVLPRGFTAEDLRGRLAPLLGLAPGALTQGRMSYELRRLRLHGLIARIPRTRRYQLTDAGLREALFLSRSYLRLLRPGLSHILADAPPSASRLRAAFGRVDDAIREWCDDAKLAA